MIRPWHAKYVLTLGASALLAGFSFAATTHNMHEPSATPATGKMGTTCLYTAGPRVGATHDISPMQTPVNTPCSDGAGSTGVIIATPAKADAKTALANEKTALSNVKAALSDSKAGPNSNEGMGTVCGFTSGPRAGTSQDYAPMQAPLNMPCTDGAGSSGTIVATSTAPKTGTECKFTSGPKAGTTLDFAPMHAPVNTPCDDGAGSSGVFVAAPRVGSVCKFTAGPKAGTTHDYAPMHAPLDTPCDDGAGSSGIIIAAPKVGSVCSFSTGPKAGTSHDYAPLHAPLGTPCDDGAGSSGVIAAHAAAAASAPASTPKPAAAASSEKAAESGSASSTTPAPPTANSSATTPGEAASSSNGAPAATPVAAKGNSGQGSVCRLTAGPMAGTVYDFSPMHASIGSPCNYGSENTGVVVAGAAKPPAKPRPPNPMAEGTVCSFTSGPLALTTADFAPKRAPLGTPCTDGYGSKGFIVEH